MRRIITSGFMIGIFLVPLSVFQSWLAWGTTVPIPFLIGFLGTYSAGKRGNPSYTNVLVGLLTLGCCSLAIWGWLFIVMAPFALITSALGILVSRWFL
jgi:hypothetical protein